MTQRQQQPQDSSFGRLIATAIILWALWTWPPSAHADPVHLGLWWFGAVCAAIGVLKLLPTSFFIINTFRKLCAAFGYNDTKGSAGFLSEKNIRRLKLHKRSQGSRFAGIVGKTPLWLWTETSHLILGPSGSQKTTAAIINFLMGCAESALITDIKGELWQTTRAHRQKAFGHRCEKVDPTDPENSVFINPIDPVVQMVERNDPAALTCVRDMALQLAPDPKGGGGQNDIFYKGARGLIVTTVLCVVIILPPEHRNLAMVYRALSDMDILHDLLDAASQSEVMNGEIADMAKSTHQMAFGDGGNAKTFESFRMNAMIAMEAFGPGNYLAAITSETTFDFADLKKEKASLYILIDFANSAVLAQFAGLLQWMASREMVTSGNNKPVLFILDEFCNAPVQTLPKILTLLRSAGVRVVMATQDLDDITRVYSKHALETVLSETHIKQFLGGIRSKTTLEYLSNYLGEYSELSSSYSLGNDQVQESINRANRKLLTPDEIRRLPDDAQLIIYGSHQPILAKKVQVFAVSDWNKKLAVNSSYGSKNKIDPREVKIGRFGTRVTRYGAKQYRKMASQVLRRDPAKGRFVRSVFGWVLPGPVIIGFVALAVTAYLQGLPNLRWTYAYVGPAHVTPVTYISCHYIGPTSPGIAYGPRCPLILWRKTW